MSVIWAASSNGLLGGFQRSSASSPPAAAWPSLIGAEMMVGGGCDNSADWTLGVGVTVNVVAGKMVATATSNIAENDGTPDSAFVADATYRNAFTIDSRSAGSAQIFLQGVPGTSRSTAATFSEDIVAGEAGNDGWIFQFTSATMQLDNFSVKSVGLLGVEADWTFVGVGVSWAGTTFPDGVQFGGPVAGVTASLTGTAKTAFDAAVSNSTLCSVTVTSDNNGLTGTVQVAMKGGAAVDFTFDGSPFQTVTHNVTSGTGSGFQLISGNDEPDGRLIRVAIVLV